MRPVPGSAAVPGGSLPGTAGPGAAAVARAPAGAAAPLRPLGPRD